MEIVKSVFQSKSKRYQFIRYCTVGTLAAGIHYGVYYLLQEYEMTNLNKNNWKKVYVHISAIYGRHTVTLFAYSIWNVRTLLQQKEITK